MQSTVTSAWHGILTLLLEVALLFTGKAAQLRGCWLRSLKWQQLWVVSMWRHSDTDRQMKRQTRRSYRQTPTARLANWLTMISWSGWDIQMATAARRKRPVQTFRAQYYLLRILIRVRHAPSACSAPVPDRQRTLGLLTGLLCNFPGSRRSPCKSLEPWISRGGPGSKVIQASLAGRRWAILWGGASDTNKCTAPPTHVTVHRSDWCNLKQWKSRLYRGSLTI